MNNKKSECALRIVASTKRGRLLECPGHKGFILEFGPLVIRLRDKEFLEIADSIDQLATPDAQNCPDCKNDNCRGNNFVVEISKPRVSIEFHSQEVPWLHELLIEARLSIMLWNNGVLRP